MSTAPISSAMPLSALLSTDSETASSRPPVAVMPASARWCRRRRPRRPRPGVRSTAPAGRGPAEGRAGADALARVHARVQPGAVHVDLAGAGDAVVAGLGLAQL